MEDGGVCFVMCMHAEVMSRRNDKRDILQKTTRSWCLFFFFWTSGKTTLPFFLSLSLSLSKYVRTYVRGGDDDQEIEA